jgi:preprotein translocase subunit SecF
MLTVAFDNPPQLSALNEELSSLGYGSAIVQETGSEDFMIRLPAITDGEKNSLKEGLTAAFGGVTERSFESVDPVIAAQTSRIAVIAVAAATVGILLYLTYAFFALLAAIFGWEVNLMFIIGILAVIGYSVNNTVVIFDRIRENKLRETAPDFEGVVNRSVTETLVRSVNTSLTTIIVVLALMLFVGATIQNLAVVMLIGILVGTYGSVFVAPAALVIWDNLDRKRRRARATA